jgi:hypothetical protein
VNQRQLFRYAYRIDPGMTTPEQMNRLWSERHRGTRLAEAFRVRPASDQDGLGALGITDNDREWWYEPGGGCSLAVEGDEERDRALLRFFIDHMAYFEKIVFGPIEQSPNAKDGVWIVTARGNEEPAAGEAS